MLLSTPHFSPVQAQPTPPVAQMLPIHGRAALLTCMHGTVDCGQLLGAGANQLPIVRNAGARVTEDALRSLLLAYEAFGAQHWFIVQHSDCGMALLSPEVTENLWSGAGPRRADRALTRHDRVGSPEHATLGRLLMEERTQSLAADLTWLRTHPRLPRAVSVHGYFYDLSTGALHAVAGE